MIDELHLTRDELKMMTGTKGKRPYSVENLAEKYGEVPPTVVGLGRLSKKLRMVWTVTSSSCLLDMQGGDRDDNLEEKLTTLIYDAGYLTFHLNRVMRTSYSIAEATSPNNMNSYHTIADVGNHIAAGSSSTVLGTRPTVKLYKGKPDDYHTLAFCVLDTLAPLWSKKMKDDKEKTENYSVAIICNEGISASELYAYLSGFIAIARDKKKKENMPACLPEVHLYTAGVEEFEFNKPKYGTVGVKNGVMDHGATAVEAWMDKKEIILTHQQQIRQRLNKYCFLKSNN